MTSLRNWLAWTLTPLLLSTVWGRDILRDVSPSRSDGPTPPLAVSVDGICGSGTTCSGSTWGQCCSAHGYCGDTDPYCGDGCNPAFGNCNTPDLETTNSASFPTASICRVTVTGTTWVTMTTTARGGISTCPLVSSYSLSTIVLKTQTVTAQLSPSTVTVVSTQTVSITAPPPHVHQTPPTTVVSTQTIYITVAAASLSNIKTSSQSPTSTGGNQPHSTVIRPPPAPSPTLPGTAANCMKHINDAWFSF